MINNNDKEIKLLLRFMKENGIYSKSLELMNKNENSINDLKDKYQKKKLQYQLSQFFDNIWAFGCWDTEYEFWYTIHNKWMKYHKTNIT